MARTATLKIDIISDASGASRGLDDASSKLDRFQSGLNKASIVAAGALGGLALLGKSAFDAASAMEQSSGAISAVFGQAAGDIAHVAEDAARGVGLSTAAYQEQAAALGAMLRNMGVAQDQLAPTTERLIQWGADLAAVYGGTAQDAVEALGSALRGETDPIERYGISIKQANIDAALAAQGLNAETATTAQRTAALLGLIQSQATPALGQWSQQTGTAAEQMQIASAEWDNAAATLGQQLLPVVTTVTEKLSEFAGWVKDNKALVTGLAIAIGSVAAAVVVVNTALTVYRTIMAIVTAAQWLWNLAMSANPIGIIILLVAGLVALVVGLIEHFGGFRAVIEATGRVFSSIWGVILDAIGWVWDKIKALGGVFADIFGWIGKVMSPVVDVIKWIADKIAWVINAAKKVAGFVGGLFDAPAPAPAPAGGTRGLLGAPAGLRAAGLLTAGGSIGSPSGSPAAGAGQVINVTVNGALDPVAVGKQLQNVLRDYSRRTGRQVAVQL